MATGVLEERRRALEEAFFQKFNEKLRANLRAEREHDERREKLGQASGIGDPAVLESLLRLGIEAETLAALAIVPLVVVAWADGKLDRDERDAVLEAARGAGVGEDSVAYALLEGWLAYRPGGELFDAWLGYAETISETVGPEEREALKRNFSDRARQVAEASGGFLGLTSKVSSQEKEILARIEAAF